MKYRHYENGRLYEIVDNNVIALRAGAAKERYVVYKQIGDRQLYTRPYDEFFGTAETGEIRYTPIMP